MAIRHCEVTKPPTSGELKDQLHAAMGATALSIYVREMRDFPIAEDEPLTFWIDRVLFEPQSTKGMQVVGITPEGSIVSIDTDLTPRDERAQIDIITPDLFE